jgi:hypothetical protein
MEERRRCMRNSNDSLVSATATLRKPRPIGLAQYSCLNQQPRSIMFLSQATVLDVTQTLDNPFPPWPRLTTKTAARDGMEIHMRICGSILEAVEMISLQVLKYFLLGTEVDFTCSEMEGGEGRGGHCQRDITLSFGRNDK